MLESKKRTIIRLLVIILSVLLLAAGIAILGYYTFFPAKIKLMIAGYNSTVKLYNCIDKNMDFLKARYFSPVFENTIQEKSRIGVSANEELLSVFLSPEEASEVLPHINRLALKYENQLDVRNRKLSSEWGLSYLLNPVLTARLSIDGSRFNFGVDELSNKTITGEMSDLGKLSYFFPNIPRVYWTMVENTDPWIFAKIIENIEIDRKAIKKIMLDYSREVIAGIDSKNMSVRKQKTDVLGKELTCREIAIKLDENTQKESALKIIRKISEDDLVYSLSAGNMKIALEVLSESEYYRDLISSAGLAGMFSRDSFRESLSRLEEEILNASLPEVTLKIYIHGIDIVKCSLVPGTGAASGTETAFFSCEQRISGPSFEFGIKTDSGQDNEKTALHVLREYNEAEDLSSIELALDTAKTLFGSPADCSLSIKTVEETINKNEVNHRFDAAIEYNIPDIIGEGKLDISLKGTKAGNPRQQAAERDYKGKLTIDIPFLCPDPLSVDFYWDTEAIYGEEISIPAPDDVLDLKTATEDDFNELIAEVYEKIDALGRLTGAF